MQMCESNDMSIYCNCEKHAEISKVTPRLKHIGKLQFTEPAYDE